MNLYKLVFQIFDENNGEVYIWMSIWLNPHGEEEWFKFDILYTL